jgi:hypothetical protein
MRFMLWIGVRMGKEWVVGERIGLLGFGGIEGPEIAITSAGREIN